MNDSKNHNDLTPTDRARRCAISGVDVEVFVDSPDKKLRPYWLLMSRQGRGNWSPEFGDYYATSVKMEMEDQKRNERDNFPSDLWRDYQIVKIWHDESKAQIDDVISAVNKV